MSIISQEWSYMQWEEESEEQHSELEPNHQV